MWYILALLIGAGLVALVWFLNQKGMAPKWYEILIFVIGLALLCFAIQNIVGTKAEFEDKAATVFFWAFVPASVILMIVAGVLPFLRIRGASNK